MDAAVEFFFPSETQFDSFSFEAPKYEWQGRLYVQGPPECNFGSNFILKRDSKFEDYNMKDWPPYFRNIPLICISIFGDGLDIFRARFFGQEEMSMNIHLRN